MGLGPIALWSGLDSMDVRLLLDWCVLHGQRSGEIEWCAVADCRRRRRTSCTLP